MSDPFPVLRVAGSHREVGRQIGEAAADQIRTAVAFDDELAEVGRTREEQLALAARYRAATEPVIPAILDELDGCAEAAWVDPLAFFAASIEEIWYAPRSRATQGRCSDMVAGPAATADGHLLLAHNNDLSPSAETELWAIEKSVDGEPVIFQLGGAPWLSIGFNSAGLALTGNELSPNDERIGVSRSLQVLELMRMPTVDEAVRVSLLPERASSYNNVLTHRDGTVVNVEGSATDAELTGLDEADILAHTNNYVCDRMLPFEGDPAYAKRSQIRYDRARTLLSERREAITTAGLRGMLADHEGAPDSLCRHPEDGNGATKTVFWCVADMTELHITYGRGNPCDSQDQAYSFKDPAPKPA